MRASWLQVRADLESTGRELADARRELDELRAEAAGLVRERDEARKEVGELEIDLAATKSELFERTHDAAVLGDRLSVIEVSTTWRMTSGLRSFLGRHRRLGRAARRGVRLIYWTVTLQLATRLRARTQSEPVEDEGYSRWVDIYDTFDDGDLRALARSSSRLGRKPVISVVMPVYETPERLLREAIDSVLHQAYDRWELCIADDSSTSPHVKEVLDEYALADSRLKVIRLPEQSGIAKASNAALEQATGEFVALLDHDDLLRPHALLMVASAINDHPEAVFVYSDEDKVDDRGERFVPNFKPDWNPALLLSQNYLCHLSVFRRDRALAVGGFRTGFDGSQDWDLFLRLTQGLDPISIVHIPHVLYHWRAAEGSTAKSGGAKPYALEAGARAVADHLEAVGAEAEVSTVGTAVQRVLYAGADPGAGSRRDRADRLHARPPAAARRRHPR